MLYERWEWCPDCKTVTQGFLCSTSDIQNTASILLGLLNLHLRQVAIPKPRRTAICLTILIYYTLPPAVTANVTSTIWTEVPLLHMSAWSFPCTALRNWRFRTTFRWLPGSCITSPLHWIASIICMLSLLIFGIEEELQEAHGVKTHLLTVLCAGPSSNIPSDTANISSNQECPIDTHSDNWCCSTMLR